MTFNIIGSGNTAWFFATRLTASGHHCSGIYSRNRETAQELATAVHSKVYTQLSDIKDGDDCCIIAIADHAIEGIAARLAFKKTVLVHTAGAVIADILDVATADYGVIWPVYSIIKTSLPEHRNIPCVCEASTPKALRVITELASSITDIVQATSPEQRKWLHLSAVLGNNFANHLMAIAEKICITQHIPFDILRPILQQTCERIASASPYQQQTGPARRGDLITIRNHMDMLRPYPELQELYSTLTESIENMYRK